MDGVLDVGANKGQFSLACRLVHRDVSITGFEPIPTEGAFFRAIHKSDPATTLVECALGEKEGSAILHVTGRADSSSLLPVGDLQAKLFPGTEEVTTLQVQVRRLDDLSSYWSAGTSLLLKLDVQGFELSVLKGAANALRHCRYVYAECSHEILYEGQALYPEVERFLSLSGFAMVAYANEQRVGGRLIQADYLFERTEVKHSMGEL